LVGYWQQTIGRLSERLFVYTIVKRLTSNCQKTQSIVMAGDSLLVKGTYMAKWVLGGKHLSGQWLLDARGMAFKYIGQLVDEATSKLHSQELELRKQQEAIESRIDREVAEERAILESEI